MVIKFTKTHDIDYTEVPSYVIHINYLLVLLSLAVNQDWSLHQLHVSTTFLNSNLDKYVFLSQPQGGRQLKFIYFVMLFVSSNEVLVLEY